MKKNLLFKKINFLRIKLKAVSLIIALILLINMGYSQNLTPSLSHQIKNNKISLRISNTSLRSILIELQHKSNMGIAFMDNGLIDSFQDMSIDVKNMSTEEALNILLKNTGLTYKIQNNSINIIKIPQVEEKKNFSLQGVVINKENNQVIVGATVLIHNTSEGAISNGKGEFEINVKIGDVLDISYVGMKPMQHKVTSTKNNIKIIMEVDAIAVENVVILGQANISRKSFTGNAKTIKGEDLLKVSRTNVIKALQSFDPSFKIAENIQFGSDPNALPDVYIRGRSSLGAMELNDDALSKNNLTKNPNTPTFIMDGFEVNIQKVYDLDPNRIQSMTILKDAAATAMYGSRAANGVVVITTIPAKDGELRVNYNLTTTMEIPDLSGYDLMNSKEKLNAEVLAGVYTPADNEDLHVNAYRYLDRWNSIYVENVDTDWKSLPLRTAFKHKHSLTVDGGNSGIQYGFNMNYTGDNGVMRGSNRNNAGAELYLQFVFGSFNIRNSVSYTSSWSNDSPYGDFGDYTHKLPYNKYKDEQGDLIRELIYGGTNNSMNPMYEAELGNFSKSSYEELIDNLEIRWSINEYLRATGSLSFTKRWDESNRFVDPLSISSSSQISADNLFTGDLYTGTGGSFDMSARFGLSYNRSLDKHNINFNLNGEILQASADSFSAHYIGFGSSDLNSINHASELYAKPTSNKSESRSAGVTGIFNYSYDNIYLADFSARYEGSSMFGENQKAAPFWAGGFGVNIHNYEFMKGVTAISRLKVRASYGQVGNINFPPYAAQNYYTSMYDDWYATGFGTKIDYLGNPDLKAEKTNTLDAGIDMSFLSDRLKVVATYYNKTTVDMINDVTVPSSSGFVVYKDNLGKVKNIGYELEIYATLVQKKDFNLVVNANFATNKNTLIEIAESLKNYNDKVDGFYDDYEYNNNDIKYTKPFLKYEEGGSLTSIFGMQSLGINPATGQEIYRDRHNNIVYDWESSQQAILGNTEAKGQGNFGLNARYKNISLYASFSYEFGGQRYNNTLVDYVENVDIENSNADKRVLTDRWKKPGDISPLKDIADNSRTRSSSRFVQDYNLLSLNSVSIQYEFADRIAKSLHLERLRIEASASDIFRLCSVKQERGLSYPFARAFNFSLMVNF